jgi:ribosomal protein S12 methylthiotransferase
MEDLIEEAKTLAADGIKELILVAQETTLYGTDLYHEKRLHVLLRELCKIEELRWIRVLYCYPEEIYPELIQTMKEEPKICHYMDIPIQHANDEVLKRMGRKTSQADLRRVVETLRTEIPDIAIRTTLITGFPGETEEQFRDVCDFISEMKFDRLGVFTYSCEEGTAAALMDGQVDAEVMQNRKDELMTIQQEISSDRGQDLIGSTMEVFIEGYLSAENAYVGRTYADIPNVDGMIFIQTNETLHSGDFVKVIVTGAMEYDLVGKLVDEDTDDLLSKSAEQ